MPALKLLTFESPDDILRPDVEFARKKLRIPNYLRDEEFASILKVADDLVRSAGRRRDRLLALRDRLHLNIGLYCGTRVGETCHLRIEHIDLARAEMKIEKGKTGDRIIPIPSKLLELLRTWIGKQNYGWLVYGEAGWHVGHRTIQESTKRLAKLAGIKRVKVTSHTLRHAYACRLLNTGANIKEVQDLLGHATIKSTEVYLHSDPSRLRAAVERL